MKRLAAALLTALAATGGMWFATGSPASAHATSTEPAAQTQTREQAELTLARQASARYHDVQTAIADGFVPTQTCTDQPGVGGMGYHYSNPANIRDGVLDVTKPEMLLYVPTGHGPRLAGVEFFKADADQNLATDDDRPTLFGVDFNGPMPGHQPGMPIHYDLHVWLWMDNPSGMFAPWNPRVTCPTATTT